MSIPQSLNQTNPKVQFGLGLKKSPPTKKWPRGQQEQGHGVVLHEQGYVSQQPISYDKSAEKNVVVLKIFLGDQRGMCFMRWIMFTNISCHIQTFKSNTKSVDSSRPHWLFFHFFSPSLMPKCSLNLQNQMKLLIYLRAAWCRGVRSYSSFALILALFLLSRSALTILTPSSIISMPSLPGSLSWLFSSFGRFWFLSVRVFPYLY